MRDYKELGDNIFNAKRDHLSQKHVDFASDYTSGSFKGLKNGNSRFNEVNLNLSKLKNVTLNR